MKLLLRFLAAEFSTTFQGRCKSLDHIAPTSRDKVLDPLEVKTPVAANPDGLLSLEDGVHTLSFSH